MPAQIIGKILASAKAVRRPLVLPEGADARVLGAARRLLDEGIADPVLLGARAEVEAAAAPPSPKPEFSR